MKKLLLFSLFLSFFACNKSDDTPDSPPENSDQVNFTVTALVQDINGDYITYEITEGSNLGPAVNLSNQFDFGLSTAYVVDGSNIVFYPRFIETKSWRHNVVTGSNETFEDYFEPITQDHYQANYAAGNHLISFHYFLDDPLPWPIYLRSYDIRNGNTSEVFLTDTDFNPNEVATRFADGDTFVAIFWDAQGNKEMKVVDLNNLQNNSTFDISNKSNYTIVNNDVYLFSPSEYQMFDSSSSTLSESVSVTDQLFADAIFFRSSLFDGNLAFEVPFAQPSLISRGPALYNLNTTEARYFDFEPLLMDFEEISQFFSGSDLSVINQQEGVIVLAYAYSTQQSGVNYGLAFVNYQMELISSVTLPYPVKEIIIHP